jgi:hypothetical protein
MGRMYLKRVPTFANQWVLVHSRLHVQMGLAGVEGLNGWKLKWGG